MGRHRRRNSCSAPAALCSMRVGTLSRMRMLLQQGGSVRPLSGARLAEQRAPHPLFSTSWYLGNEDVLAAQWSHCALSDGWLARRSFPHPLFDVGWYLSQNPDVAVSGVEPLTHYLRRGWREARAPHPLFDVTRYLLRYQMSPQPAATLGPLSQDRLARRTRPTPSFSGLVQEPKSGRDIS